MATEQDRFEKILALAIDPSAYEGEAAAALRRALEMIQRAIRNCRKVRGGYTLTRAERDARAFFAAVRELRTMFDKFAEARRAFLNRWPPPFTIDGPPQIGAHQHRGTPWPIRSQNRKSTTRS
jgi:hypothetical protein